MATRKPFLLRTDPEVLAALNRWATDELRSVNAQIDFLLRRALREAGRLPRSDDRDHASRGVGVD
ncbi:MAG: Arc family DNA binding domain-containing protein [Gammaproteobacteria bacterium]|nr:Arc family DNA binding domain-containing protein [Gammaproteobacteria bacterium]